MENLSMLKFSLCNNRSDPNNACVISLCYITILGLIEMKSALYYVELPSWKSQRDTLCGEDR